MRYSLFLRLFLDKSQILCIILSCSRKCYKYITFINFRNIFPMFFNILFYIQSFQHPCRKGGTIPCMAAETFRKDFL